MNAKSWYVANMGNDHQGLVIEERTGRNVAVTYDKADAPLVAEAPDLLAALEDVQDALACYRDNQPYIHPKHGKLCLEEVKYTIVDPAIAKCQPIPSSSLAAKD